MCQVLRKLASNKEEKIFYRLQRLNSFALYK